MPHGVCECHVWNYSAAKTRCPRCGEKVKWYNAKDYVHPVINYEENPVGQFTTKGMRRFAILGSSIIDLGDTKDIKEFDPKKMPKVNVAIGMLARMPLFPGVSDYNLAQHAHLVSALMGIQFKQEWQLCAMLYNVGEIITGRINDFTKNCMGMVLTKFLEDIHDKARRYYLARGDGEMILADPAFKSAIADCDRWAMLRAAEVCFSEGFRPKDNPIWGPYPDSIKCATFCESMRIMPAGETETWAMKRIADLVKKPIVSPSSTPQSLPSTPKPNPSSSNSVVSGKPSIWDE